MYVFGIAVAVMAAIACAHEIPKHEGIAVLTNSNLSIASTGDWLLIFYAPWCPHCHSVLDILSDVADKIKAENPAGMIGVIDADAEPSVQMQFSTKGFPSIYVAHDGEVYQFPLIARTVDSLSQFLLKDYTKYEHITGFKAPFGIPMRAFGLYSAFAISSYRFLEVYAKMFNIPPMWFFCAVAVLIAVFVIVVMILISRCRQPKKSSVKAKNPKKEDSITAPIVQQARAENPIEGAAIAGTEKVQEQVKKAKEEQKLHRRSAKKDEEGVREEQKRKSKMNRSSKGGVRQQNMPTQQPSKHN